MKVKQAVDVYHKKIDGSVVILEKDKKHIRELNSVAGFIWRLAVRPIEVGQIIDKVIERYEVSRAEAKRDVSDFLKKYIADGFLVKA